VSHAWRWLDRAVVVAAHERQLAEHGGGVGMRDAALLDSALARPLNLAAHGKPDAPALAAAYGYDIARNQAFIDGNKRTALVATELFLRLNSWALLIDDAECVFTMLAVATGDISEKELAGWVRAHAVKRN
jgi:death on curing protein